MKKFLIGLSVLLCCQAVAQTVSLSPFYGGRQAALSLTFDDGLQDQYTLAFPELQRRGLRATFAVIGSKVGGVMHSNQDRAMGISGTPCMTWDMLREMAADGHEISSHGWEHKKVQRLTAEQLRYEVQHNDSVIYRETGQFPRTYFFPGNSRDSATLAYCMHDRVACRTFQTAIGSKRDTTWLRRWVDSLIGQGQWGVGMTHGIAMGYDHFPDPQVLWRFLDYVVTQQDRLWVAPFCEVAAYIAERDNTKLAIVSENDTTIELSINSTLAPKLFRQPLTLLVAGLAIAAQQDGRQLEIVPCGELTVINGVSPADGNVLITVKPKE